MKKEYIVTGATGYVGYVLVEKLIEKGYQPIKLLVRSQRSVDRFKDFPVTAVIGDLNDYAYLEKEITANSVVFHLAGLIDIGGFKKKEIYNTNVNATIKIAETCVKNNAEKLIYVSSVSAIEPAKNNEPIKEPSSFNPKKVVGDYAKTKAIATEYILNESRNGTLNAVVVYPSAVIGPHDHNISNIGQVVLGYMNNKFPAYTKGKYNFIDVRDVVDGLIKSYEIGKNGEDYVLTGDTVDLKEMFVILNHLLNRKKMPFYVPLPILYIALPFARLYYFLRRQKPIFSRTSLKILNQNSNFDCSKAKKDLNFNPLPVKTSFKDMIDWFYDNKKELLKGQKN